eukprot:4464983-Pleurochrysis_carterae.AAC.3
MVLLRPSSQYSYFGQLFSEAGTNALLRRKNTALPALFSTNTIPLGAPFAMTIVRAHRAMPYPNAYKAADILLRRATSSRLTCSQHLTLQTTAFYR